MCSIFWKDYENLCAILLSLVTVLWVAVDCYWYCCPYFIFRVHFKSKTLLLLSELFLLLRSCLKVTATFSSAVVALLVPQNWIAVVVISRHKDLPAASFNMKTTFLSSQGFQHLTIHMHQKNAWLYTAKSFQAFLLQNWAN